MKFGVGGLAPCRQHPNLCSGFQTLVSEAVSVTPGRGWGLQLLRLWSWVQILDTSITVCKTSGKWYKLPEPQFSICKMGLIIILPPFQSCSEY